VPVGHTPCVTDTDPAPHPEAGSTADPPARVDVVERLGAHAGRWDDLVAEQPLPSPFLRSWWLDHLAGGRPALVLVTAGGSLLGGAAFELDTVGAGPLRIERVRMLGQGVLAPDHLDVVAAPGHHREVADGVLGWLRRRGQRIIDLDGLSADGTLATVFAPYVSDRTAAPWALLDGDADAYLAARPGAVRSTVTRSRKRFERDGVQVRTVGPDGVGAALDALAELHDERWSTGSTFLRAWTRFRAAALDGARRGEVVLHELVDADGQVVASELDLIVGDRVGFYQAGRRTEREWRGCGSVVRAAAVRHAADSGASEYDLLRGDESYKQDWATGRREVVRVTAPHGTLAALALRWADRRRRPGEVTPGPSRRARGVVRAPSG